MKDKIGTLLALGGLLLIVGIDFLIFRVFKSGYFDRHFARKHVFKNKA